MRVFLRYVEIAAKNAARKALDAFSCAFHHCAILTGEPRKRDSNHA